jgi:hypothetical protein
MSKGDAVEGEVHPRAEKCSALSQQATRAEAAQARPKASGRYGFVGDDL